MNFYHLDANQAILEQLNQPLKIKLPNQTQPSEASVPNHVNTTSSHVVDILETVTVRPPNRITPKNANEQNVPPRNLSHQTVASERMNPNAIMKIKSDPDAAQYDPDILLKVHEQYNIMKKWIPYTESVRPWFLEDYAKKPNINVITQFALYKCMHDVCLFACDSEENWKAHMDEHLNLIDLLATKNLLNRNYRAELTKFRECPYCGSESNCGNATNNKKRFDQVCRHIEMEHRRNTMQCAYCFFRTIEMDHMVWHMEKYHATCDREILLYGIHRDFQDSDLEILNEGCSQYITEIKCNLGELIEAKLSS